MLESPLPSATYTHRLEGTGWYSSNIVSNSHRYRGMFSDLNFEIFYIHKCNIAATKMDWCSFLKIKTYCIHRPLLSMAS